MATALVGRAPLPPSGPWVRRAAPARLTDIVSLRRGELISRRIGFEEQRLEFHRANKHEQLEQLFWEWTRRPDIQTRLYPHRDPDKMHQDVVRLLDRQLFGRKSTTDNLPEPDPACFI